MNLIATFLNCFSAVSNILLDLGQNCHNPNTGLNPFQLCSQTRVIYNKGNITFNRGEDEEKKG